MSSRAVVAVAVIAAAAGLAWWLLGRGPAAPVAPPGPAAVNAAATEESPEAAAARKRAANTWKSRGTGAVEGVLREYGTDRPLGGVRITLAAGVPGPDASLDATTLPDGSFLVEKAPNFEAWTLTAAVAAPLAAVEIPGVEVIEGRVTDLGVLYATPGFSVPGIVVDEAGKPVPGATVKAIRGRPSNVRMDFLRIIRELPRPHPAVETAVTNAEGKFALTRIVPGEYDLEVAAKGFRTTAERGLIVNPAAAAREIRVVLVRGNTLRGRVLRRDEGAVAGLRVVCIPQPEGDEEIFGIFEKSLGVTDEKGDFQLEGLGSGVRTVGVDAEGEPIHLALNVSLPREEVLEILLQGDAWIEGKVSDPEKGPIAGAQVYLVDFRDRAPTIGFATTDAAGRYVVRGLSSGPVQLFMVQAEGYGTYPEDFMSVLRGGSSDVVLQPGRNEKDVALGKGGIVKGQILDRETKEPVEGVRVSLASFASFFGGARTGTTNAEGRFEIGSVPLGGAILVLAKDGWAQPGLNPTSLASMAGAVMAGSRPDPGKGYSVSIEKPGDVVERTLEISRGSVISGTVLDPAGAAVPGAKVTVEFASTPGGMMRQVSSFVPLGDPRLAAEDGTFSLTSPAANQKIVVTARAQGFLDGRSEDFQTKTGEPTEGLVVRLRAGATLRGVVKGPGGKPVEGALVRFTTMEEGQDWGRRWRLESARPARTDAAGAWRIPHVEPGRLIVQATHPAFVSASVEGVEAADGKDAEVSFDLAGAAGLSGKVFGPDGKPCGGASLDVDLVSDAPEGADPNFRTPSNVVSASDGAFSLPGLMPGRYSIRASSPGSADSEVVTAEAGGEPVTLRLLPAFAISGSVRSRSGEAVANVRVRARKEGTDEDRSWRNSATSGRDGRWEVRDIPAGTYEITAEAGWGIGPGKPNLVPVTVKGVNAGTRDLLIETDEGLRISGTVLRADGTPVAEGWVNANPVEGSGGHANGPILDGKFELAGLKPGKYNLHVGGGDLPQKVVRAEAGTENVKIQYGQGGSLEGRVLKSDGTPGAKAWVNATGPEGGSGIQAGDDGRFVLKELPDGVYTVTAYVQVGDKGFSGHAANVTVANGAGPSVEITLGE
jgi:hypothetical protein